jgi:hypothetical protein
MREIKLVLGTKNTCSPAPVHAMDPICELGLSFTWVGTTKFVAENVVKSLLSMSQIILTPISHYQIPLDLR